MYILQIYKYMYIYAYICIYIYVYIYVCMYIYNTISYLAGTLDLTL